VDLALLVVVLVVVAFVAGGVGIGLAIWYFGRAQQQKYAAEVAAGLAATQPDAAFLERQAEIEKNLAAADALAAELAMPQAPPPAGPGAAAAGPDVTPPDPVL
jgi:uncharacterized protein HemX